MSAKMEHAGTRDVMQFCVGSDSDSCEATGYRKSTVSWDKTSCIPVKIERNSEIMYTYYIFSLAE
jgi:hypothetical protein